MAMWSTTTRFRIQEPVCNGNLIRCLYLSSNWFEKTAADKTYWIELVMTLRARTMARSRSKSYKKTRTNGKMRGRIIAPSFRFLWWVSRWTGRGGDTDRKGSLARHQSTVHECLFLRLFRRALASRYTSTRRRTSSPNIWRPLCPSGRVGRFWTDFRRKAQPDRQVPTQKARRADQARATADISVLHSATQGQQKRNPLSRASWSEVPIVGTNARTGT